MTNNINGIDVSECEQIFAQKKCALLDQVYCEDNPDCYFKQLKRLQKENEELYEKNVQLQKENEELKKRQITKNGFICDCEQNAKYKQALEEIKKRATHHNPCDIDPEIKCTKEDCFNCLNYDMKVIIKIIDEVLK